MHNNLVLPSRRFQFDPLRVAYQSQSLERMRRPFLDRNTFAFLYQTEYSPLEWHFESRLAAERMQLNPTVEKCIETEKDNQKC